MRTLSIIILLSFVSVVQSQYSYSYKFKAYCSPKVSNKDHRMVQVYSVIEQDYIHPLSCKEQIGFFLGEKIDPNSIDGIFKTKAIYSHATMGTKRHIQGELAIGGSTGFNDIVEGKYGGSFNMIYNVESPEERYFVFSILKLYKNYATKYKSLY